MRGYKLLNFPVLAGMFSVIASGCNGNEISNCPLLSADQSASLMAPALDFPLTVAVDPRFTLRENTYISQAVHKWNAFGQNTIGHDLFKAVSGTVPGNLMETTPMDCGRLSDLDAKTLFVVRELNEDNWKSMGFNPGIPGATFRCTGGGSLTAQSIFIYDQFIYSENQGANQFESVILHELGHTLGLDHSCIDKSGQPNYAACANLPDSHPYHQAVMFPSLRMRLLNGPEIKETLSSNDQSRTRCLLNAY